MLEEKCLLRQRSRLEKKLLKFIVNDMEELDSKSLRAGIYQAKKDLFDLRIKQSSDGLSDTSQIKKKRRLVALLNTKLNSGSLRKRISK